MQQVSMMESLKIISIPQYIIVGNFGTYYKYFCKSWYQLVKSKSGDLNAYHHFSFPQFIANYNPSHTIQ